MANPKVHQVMAFNRVERRQGVLRLEPVGNRVVPFDHIVTICFQTYEFFTRRVLRLQSAHNLRDPGNLGVEAIWKYVFEKEFEMT